jgi:2-C-methyl-D-erythritol 4-phosphate cytidylyltransferase
MSIYKTLFHSLDGSDVFNYDSISDETEKAYLSSEHELIFVSSSRNNLKIFTLKDIKFANKC